MNIELLLSIVAVFVSLSGWTAFLYTLFSERPRIRGEIFTVIGGTADLGNSKGLFSMFSLFIYLVNFGRSSVHVLDYELEAKVNGCFERLDRVYAIPHNWNVNFDEKFSVEKFGERVLFN